MSPIIRTISRPGRPDAVVLETAPSDEGDALLRALGVASPRGSLVVNGSAAALGPALEGVTPALIRGLAEVAVADGLTVVTGATDAGIFSVLGAAMAAATAPLIGVAPLGCVSPDPDLGGPEETLLERNHSHFVLVQGSSWGDETSTMMALAAALARVAPTAAVLCGGGQVARNEVLAHVRAGRPIVVMAGSGRLADEVAAATRTVSPPGDEWMREVVENGHLLVCPLDDGPDALASTVRRLMAGQA